MLARALVAGVALAGVVAAGCVGTPESTISGSPPPAPMETLVTLDVIDQPASSVLEYLAQVSGVDIRFGRRIEPLGSYWPPLVITLSARNRPLREVLPEVARQVSAEVRQEGDVWWVQRPAPTESWMSYYARLLQLEDQVDEPSPAHRAKRDRWRELRAYWAEALDLHSKLPAAGMEHQPEAGISIEGRRTGLRLLSDVHFRSARVVREAIGGGQYATEESRERLRTRIRVLADGADTLVGLSPDLARPAVIWAEDRTAWLDTLRRADIARIEGPVLVVTEGVVDPDEHLQRFTFELPESRGRLVLTTTRWHRWGREPGEELGAFLEQRKAAGRAAVLSELVYDRAAKRLCGFTSGE